MEKRELKEAQCPILKLTARDSPPVESDVQQDSSAQPQAAPEERRVAFNIGDSDDGENNKERRVAFNIGDSDDTDCSDANDGK